MKIALVSDERDVLDEIDISIAISSDGTISYGQKETIYLATLAMIYKAIKAGYR